MISKLCYFSFKANLTIYEKNDVSESAKNLLRKMFELNPDDRITAKQALEDPWFKE